MSDDGVGFEPEDASLRARRLGLTSMEERARALGARLRIDSAPGRGPRSAWRWRVTEIRVLIADDHAVVRTGLRTFLELQDDMEVVADVGDGEAALEAAREHEPDVVLMDLVMPGVGGVEAIRRLREVRPEARVLVLTSFLDDEKLFPAVRAGAAGYLLKDVEPPSWCARSARSARARRCSIPPSPRA